MTIPIDGKNQQAAVSNKLSAGRCSCNWKTDSEDLIYIAADGIVHYAAMLPAKGIVIKAVPGSPEYALIPLC